MKKLTAEIIRTTSFIAACAITIQLFLYCQSLSAGILASSLIAISLGAVCFALFSLILHNIVFKVNRLRKLGNDKTIFEGLWLQSFIRKGHYFYSLVNINYRPATDTHMISGTMYYADGREVGSWRSKTLELSADDDSAFYVFRSTEADDKIGPNLGIGTIEFKRNTKNDIYTGNGQFTDHGVGSELIDFSIDRLTKNIIVEITDSKHIESREDMQNFVRLYDQNRRKMLAAQKQVESNPQTNKKSNLRKAGKQAEPLLTARVKKTA